MHRLTTVLIALTVAASSFVAGSESAPAAGGTVVAKRLQRAISDLVVAKETRRGYDRDKFRHWVDADGDCQDTRDEVLAAESLVPTSGCDIRTGRWLSYYDGVITQNSSDFDIDHLVPLAEAWDSGAKRWNDRTRQRYANDLRDSRTLAAVTASSNRSKSDQDPSDWLPARGDCRYVRQWVAVKTRWHLKVDRAEKRALRSASEGCADTRIRVRLAVVRLAGSTGGSTGGGGLDPRFDYCYEATAAGYGPYYAGTDPEYDWYVDGDSDGIACE